METNDYGTHIYVRIGCWLPTMCNTESYNLSTQAKFTTVPVITQGGGGGGGTRSTLYQHL